MNVPVTPAPVEIARLSRRQLLRLTAGAAIMPLVGSPAIGQVQLAKPHDLLFHALRDGSLIGEHRVIFRADGDLLNVETRVDIAVKVLLFTVFHFTHRSTEIWRSGRLASIDTTTDDDGTLLRVSGAATADGFRIVGAEGPYLAAPTLMTSNTLWDRRIVQQDRMLDAQYGGEIGLVAKRLADQNVDTPRGRVQASCYQMITPHYAGHLFYDAGGRWIKALLELKGESIEYELAS